MSSTSTPFLSLSHPFLFLLSPLFSRPSTHKPLTNHSQTTAPPPPKKRSLSALEAEDRLSVACEKAPTTDDVIAALRLAFNAMEAEYKAVTDEEKKEVQALGGLHVIGTERHESRRIDNQLRGRAGRQGDPGSTRFFLSLEDNLFRIFGGDR